MSSNTGDTSAPVLVDYLTLPLGGNVYAAGDMAPFALAVSTDGTQALARNRLGVFKCASHMLSRLLAFIRAS